jgi:hypothetical protein
MSEQGSTGIGAATQLGTSGKSLISSQAGAGGADVLQSLSLPPAVQPSWTSKQLLQISYVISPALPTYLAASR